MESSRNAARDDGAGRAGWCAALAPAKVNPWLALIGRRPDGYHELDTGLLALDWCDRVRARIVPAAEDGEGGVSLRLTGPAVSPDVPADRRNLAWRAAEAVLAAARAAGAVGRGVGLELELAKHVPSRAGLGGGSADAVAAGLAARAALGLGPDGPALLELARSLGSDTAFFAAAPTGFARCTGRGDVVEPLPAAPTAVALAVLTPGVEAETARVFASADGDLPAPARRPRVVPDLLELPVESIREQLFNDLEPRALRAFPRLAAWRELLDEAGAAHFRLSGSGSSFFGIFADVASASRCLDRLLERARLRGLVPRAFRVARPAGHAARLVFP